MTSWLKQATGADFTQEKIQNTPEFFSENLPSAPPASQAAEFLAPYQDANFMPYTLSSSSPNLRNRDPRHIVDLTDIALRTLGGAVDICYRQHKEGTALTPDEIPGGSQP